VAEIGLFDAIYTARSLRRFKPDPVPNEVITKVLDAAIRAPSGSNQQSWEFVVIKDAAQRKKIGAVYQKGGAILKALYADRVKPEHMSEDTYRKLTDSAYYLIDHMGDAPVLLLVCLKQVPLSGPAPKLPPEVANAMRSQARISGSSIYPAVQNIILACRGLGLGTVLTTIHTFFEDEVKEILGLPPEVMTYALMPIGYPQGKFGPIKRRPVTEVAYLDKYGQHWKG
jgi:nitroreductase